MKLIDMTCPHCSGSLKIDADRTNCFCEYCGAKLIIDHETLHLQFDNAYESGYQFEKGRQRARAEAHQKSTSSVAMPSSSPKKKKTWLWVLGWIVIFPVPLTILILKKKNMESKVKYGIIATAWVMYFCIGVLGGQKKPNNNDTKTNSDSVMTSEDSSLPDSTTFKQSQNEKLDNTVSTADKKEGDTEWSTLENCAKAMEMNLKDKLTPIETFEVQDKNSGHYHNEFRLSSYDNAIGKSFSYNSATVDFIVREDHLSKHKFPIRIYITANDFTQNLELFQAAAKAMDSELTEKDLQEAVDYLVEHKSANGYYFSNLGINFTAKEMMMKYDTD